MNFKSLETLAIATILGIALVGCSSKPDDAAAKQGSSNTDVATTLPEYREAAAVWGKVLACKATFDHVVEEKNWKSVHKAAFAIRDEVLLLPDAAKPLGEHLSTVKDQVKKVGELAEQLDEAGDKGDGPKVEALAKEMTEALNSVSAHFPEGALPKTASGKADLSAGDHDH